LEAEAYSRRWLNDGNALTMMVHPYQLQSIRNDIVDLAKPADSATRSIIKRWTMLGSEATTLIESPNVPRKITYKLDFQNITSGTFKLFVGYTLLDVPSITADITYSATPATLVSNIKTALDALSHGVWTVSGTAINDITVVAPHFVDTEDKLAVPLVQSTGLPDQALVGTNANIVITERSAKARAVFFNQNAFAFDLRENTNVSYEYLYDARTDMFYADENWGMGVYQPDRVMFVETDANSLLG
jgi:hypothetical protein